MLNIKKSSWHYRMVDAVWADFFNKNISNSLCGYFWQVVFAPIVTIVMAAVILAVIAILGSGVFYVVGAVIGNLLAHFGLLPSSFLLEKGVFKWEHVYASIGIDILIAAFFYSRYKYRQYKERKRAERSLSDEPEKVNLVVEFVKAKKRKVCPVLNFVDEEKK